MAIPNSDIENQLEIIRTSIYCPNCSTLHIDVHEKFEIKCECTHTFLVRDNIHTKERFNLNKIKELSKYQVIHTPKSSFLDKPYNPEKYISRHDFEESAWRFVENKTEKIFLLLGEAGFGKTWSVSHLAEILIAKGYITFFIPLNKGISSIFGMIFGTSNTEDIFMRLSKLESNLEKPIIWILDSYDEIFDQKDRRKTMSEIFKWMKIISKQKIVITSRSYDWNTCESVRSWERQLNSAIWTRSQKDAESFRLSQFTQKEIIAALNQYGFESINNFPALLHPLLKYPLWIRFFEENFQLKGNIPQELNSDLFYLYFERMRLREIDLQGLASLSIRLLEGKDLSKKIPLRKVKISDQSLEKLNSSGIFIYHHRIIGSTIQLSCEEFALFGMAFHAYIYHDENEKLQKLSKLLEWLDLGKRRLVINIINELDDDIIPNSGIDFKIKEEWKDRPDVDNNLNLEESLPSISEEITNTIFSSIDQITRNTAKNVDSEPNANHLTISEKKTEPMNLDLKVNFHNLSDTEKEAIKELQNLIGKQIQVGIHPPGISLKNNHVEILTLERLGLASLPDSIGNLTHLKELKATGNKFQYLPSSIGQLTNLEKLHLRDNKLSDLPASISNLHKLKTLILQYNPLDRLSESAINALRELLSNNCNISGLTTDHGILSIGSAEIEAIKDLESLIGRQIQVGIHPPGISLKNNHVDVLTLERLGLASLPDSIGNLTHLKELKATGNKFQYLPSSIGQLTNLEKLHLRDNKLSDLPASISNLHKLKTLVLQYNPLDNLSESAINALRELLSNNCNISGLTTDHGILDISNDEIEAIKDLESLIGRQIQVGIHPPGISLKNNHVDILTLERLGLASLPESIGNLIHLKELKATGNKFQYLPSSIGQLTNLEKLYLRDNRLSDLPASISNLHKLKSLILQYNPLDNLSESAINALRGLLANNCNVSGLTTDHGILDISSAEIEAIKDLESLIGRQIQVGIHPPGISLKNNHVDILTLERLGLVSLPESIGNLTHLKELKATGNKFQYLPSSIGQLVNLEKLHLRDNKLSDLPASISNLHKLKTLILQYNPLDNLSESAIASLKELLANNCYISGLRT